MCPVQTIKRLYLCLTLAFLATGIRAQPPSIGEAYASYQSGDYQTAIKLYRQRLSNRNTLHDRNMLALCYFAADSLPQAKREYAKVAASTENGSMESTMKMDACDRLARLYLSEKDHSNALHYFRLYDTIFEKARLNDVNRLRFHFYNSSDQAHCYAALGQMDSAIKVMTPYMFCTSKMISQWMIVGTGPPDPEDSLQHDSICHFYISLLQQRYTNTQIKKDFKNAEQSFMYSEQRRPSVNNFLWVQIQCAIDIYHTHVVFLEYGIGNQKDKLLQEIRTPYYSKAYQLKAFRNLPVCRMVRKLPELNRRKSVQSGAIY